MDSVFKIIFINHDKLYEIYAKSLDQSTMYGFIEVEEIVFGEQSSVLVDPAEEKLKLEFGSVKRTYIPVHNIIRIDEVSKEGQAKIHNANSNNNITSFPGKFSKNFKDLPIETKD